MTSKCESLMVPRNGSCGRFKKNLRGVIISAIRALAASGVLAVLNVRRM